MEDFLFHRVKPSYSPKDFPSVRRNGIYIVRLLKSSQAILFFHGANSDIGYNLERIKNFRRAGFSVYIPEYPGFGHNKKKATFDECCRAGLETYLQAVEDGHTQIILVGYSLGSAPACYIAGLYPHRLLVLVSAFSSILEIAVETVHSKVAHAICDKARWSNVQCLDRFRGNILIIHGKNDTLVPVRFIEKMYSGINTGKRKKLIIEDNGHNFLGWDITVLPKIISFLEELELDLLTPKPAESTV